VVTDRRDELAFDEDKGVTEREEFFFDEDKDRRDEEVGLGVETDLLEPLVLAEPLLEEEGVLVTVGLGLVALLLEEESVLATGGLVLTELLLDAEGVLTGVGLGLAELRLDAEGALTGGVGLGLAALRLDAEGVLVGVGLFLEGVEVLGFRGGVNPFREDSVGRLDFGLVLL